MGLREKFRGKVGWMRNSSRECVAELSTGEERVPECIEAPGGYAAQKWGEY